MFKQLHIKICVVIILHLHITWSYQVYQLNADEENEVLSKLRQVLQGYDIPNYAEVKPKKSRYKLKPVGKSMFVKRIIPHGYKTGEHEYDSRLNTVFKPLFRYHIIKPSAGQERAVVQETNPEQKMSNKISNLIRVAKKDRKTSKYRTLKRQLLRHIIKNYLFKDKKNRKKKRFGGLLNLKKLRDTENLLRDMEKSGEKDGQMTPGNVPPDVLPNGAQPVSKEAVTYPYYPFWNYWTYQKTVVQDQCPGNLVKLGNMCVSSIGHRRRRSRRGGNYRRSRPRQRLRYG
ncbi:uncharacterized protein LOC111351072 [Spodoptera litura]|uniref:Uncharacterized protein LOC111351072 n=1 Tax=Spodoptera litura TaxID=69820 RepID=A0A9J7DXD5_SPOLT|nr:uncharacterized protein LOC111351072 [Spodoptera litura]